MFLNNSTWFILTAQGGNAWNNYWNEFSWTSLISQGIGFGIKLIILSFLYFLIKRIGVHLIQKNFAKYKEKKLISDARANTMKSLFLNAFQYTMIFLYVYAFLTIIGIPVGTLIAGAGVAGLALAFGAQGFVSDIVTGLFNMLEKQIEVGDFVTLADIEGKVEAVGLRTTQIRSGNGVLHFIPNRNISVVSNRSRGNMRVLVDVRVSADTDLEAVFQIIQQVNRHVLVTQEDIVEEPTILGLQDLGNGVLAIRVVAMAKNGQQQGLERLLLKAYIEAIAKEGIQIPYLPIVFDK